MTQSTRCTNCGYDILGPEYIASTINSPLYNDGNYYSNSELLSLSSKPHDELICPHCKSIIDWSK